MSKEKNIAKIIQQLAIVEERIDDLFFQLDTANVLRKPSARLQNSYSSAFDKKERLKRKLQKQLDKEINADLVCEQLGRWHKYGVNLIKKYTQKTIS